MALNVEQITARLAQMPDAALQKYAAMNKNDPYIMALAVSESNRRKQMRQAAQGAQGQMPQPKVVDAAVQGMAAPMPEEMGIARLPAGDMNFADGGIVAFADGGDVERYQFGGSTSAIDRILQKPPQARTPEENAMLAQAGYAVQSRSLGPDSGVASANTFLQGIGPRMRDYFTGGASRMTDEELSARPAVGGVATERVLRGLGMGQSTAPLGPQASYSNEGRREPGMFAAAAPAAPPAAPPAPSAAAKIDTAQRAPGAPGTPAATNTPAETGLDALAKRYFGPLEQDIGALRNQRAELVAGIKDLAAQNMSDTEAAIKKRGDVFKGREERLAQREGELAGMKDKHFGLALLQAGAAMMSTPGNIGMALGKGIDVGSRQYVAGLDKLNAAKERLADARERLEDLRINRDDMNDREIRTAQREIRNAELKGKELIYNGLVSDMGMKREDVKTIFSAAASALNTDKEIASRERISAAENATRLKIAQVPGAQERIASLLGGGDIEKGLIRFAEIQAGKFNPQNAYAEYLSKRKEGDTVLSPVEFMTALRSISALHTGVPTPQGKPTGKALD